MDLWVYILVSTVQFIVLLLAIFFKSYSSKKGENQATKEDIGKITEIAEGIKKGLVDNTEKVKANLALQNEHIISLRANERDALINYYKELSSLIRFMLRTDPTIYNLNNYEDLDNVRIGVDQEFYKYDLAEAVVELFFENEAFENAKHELNTSMIKLNTLIALKLNEYKYLFTVASREIEFNKEASLEIRKKLHEGTRTFLENYYKERNEHYASTHRIILQIKKIIKLRLLEILNT